MAVGAEMYGSALLILGWSVVSAAQAQPNTLALACKGTGTTSKPEAKPEPVSFGIIVNFTTRTVQGFGAPGLIDPPVKITGANDAGIMFSGQQELWTDIHSVSGSIDRVTGDVEATLEVFDMKTRKITSQMFYALKCRPTQRMF